jgi:hypothetical protein
MEMMVVFQTMVRNFRLTPTDARGERRHTRAVSSSLAPMADVRSCTAVRVANKWLNKS